MTGHVTKEDIRSICFALKETKPSLHDLDYENLGSSSLSGKIIDLIRFCERRNSVADLVEFLQEEPAFWPMFE